MTFGSRFARGLLAGAMSLAPCVAAAQEPPRVRAGTISGSLNIDGVADEAAWSSAEVIDRFTQTDPEEGQPASARTSVRVLADASGLVVSIVCEDDEPSRIVSYSVRRDAQLWGEDHVSVVLGPFMDGRSGYVFGVNPSGARYDALIGPNGDDNSEWDGIWEAATRRTATGWSAEILIPARTISFNPDLREWHFNVQRRIQRRLEWSRWASPARQYDVAQTSRAGVLTNLPQFDLGLGLTIRPAVTAGGGIPETDGDLDGEFHPSLDVTQRLGANLLASVTVNTDFAETEVDTRRTNLTRFPLFFEEKRTFFLEGSDIFAFGTGLGEDVIPFFSRRIGLVSGRAVPILGGAKINGRVGATNLGAVVVGTNDVRGVVPDESVMAVGRVKQNLWAESSVGVIASVGDPLGRSGAWLGGADFTFATSRFRGDKNLRIGAWGLATGREDLGGDRTAFGFRAEYPNDEWEVSLTHKRIGRDFDPSLGFVPRRAVHLVEFEIENQTRLSGGPLQQMSFDVSPSAALDLSGQWESYDIYLSPLNLLFRSGDSVQFNVNPTGERLVEPFEVADGVEIPAGAYEWRRYGFEIGTAEKRRFFTEVSAWFGGFYNGTLTTLEFEATWNPAELVTLEFSGERNIGDLDAGRFTQTLIGSRLRLNVSPDLSVSSYLQYDTDSDSVGINTRLRWTFTPAADLFVVYNHNVHSLLERWRLDSNQLLVKLQYAWRM